MVVNLTAPGQVAFKNVTLDVSNLGTDEVYAETIYTAISTGTEVAAYVGEKPIRPVSNPYPRVVGYCNVAKIVRVGSGVSEYSPQDMILTFQSHRSSFVCNISEIILKIPQNNISAQHAAVTFLYHLGYETFLKCNFKPGYNVGVIGMGTLGLATINIGSIVGCGSLYAFSDYQHNLDLAKALGATVACKKNYIDIADNIQKETNGVGLDLVVTTSNTWEDWELALKLARDEGTIGVIGFPGRGQPMPTFNPLEPQYLYDKKLSIFYTGYMPDYVIPAKDIRFTRKRNCEFILKKIIDKAIFPEYLIENEYSYLDIEKVYKKILKRDSPIFTAILRWQDE